jgi:hypothetical protein
MKSINEVFEMSKDLSFEIKKAFRGVGFKDEEDFQDVDTSLLSADEMLRYEELKKAFSKLEDFNYILEYLTSPAKTEGIIHENENGRFELDNGFEFTSGNRIEALIYDDFYDQMAWVKTSVESNEKGYYLVGHQHTSMEGLKVRIR